MLTAERQGFEPRVPLGTTVFKTAAIDHSATFPNASPKGTPLSESVQRYTYFWMLQENPAEKCFSSRAFGHFPETWFPRHATISGPDSHPFRHPFGRNAG